MPWSDYPPDIRAFSGLVHAAADARFGAASTSQIVAMAARDAGISLSFQSYTGIARLYGAYVAGRTAREQVAAAAEVGARTGLDQGITSSMIWTPPYGPGPSQQLQSPYVLVKTAYTRPTPTGNVTGIFTHQYHISELTTVGGILADTQAQIDTAVGETDLQGATATSILSIERSFP